MSIECDCGGTPYTGHDEDCPSKRRTPAEQPAPASTGRIPVVESANLVTIRTRLKSAAQAGASITLSGLSACALYYAMDTGKPMASDDPAPVAARELDVEAERREFEAAYVAEFGELADAEALEIAWNTGAGRMWLARAARSAAQGTAQRLVSAEDKLHALHAEADELGAALDRDITLYGSGGAPVSTEQAGDAWQWVPKEPTIEMIAALGFAGDVDMAIGHAAISQQIEESYAAMLESAPSPNNSPVGADKEPK